MNSTPLVLKNVHGFTSSHTHTIFLCTRKILLCGTNNPETVTVGLPLPSTWVRGGTLIYLLHFPGAGGGGTKKRPGFWSAAAAASAWRRATSIFAQGQPPFCSFSSCETERTSGKPNGQMISERISKICQIRENATLKLCSLVWNAQDKNIHVLLNWPKLIAQPYKPGYSETIFWRKRFPTSNMECHHQNVKQPSMTGMHGRIA